MLTPGQRVYVNAPFRRGAATVQRVSPDGQVRVKLDSGSAARVAPEHVRPLTSAAVSVNALVSSPQYGDDGGLSAVAKSKPVRSRAYLAWVRTLPCQWCSASAPSEASHHAEDGHGSTGMKTHDLDTLPLCHGCHGMWHQRGTLGSMTGEQARQWAQVQIKRTVQRYLIEVLELRAA